MNIYMISLARDVERRKKMQERFPKNYERFHIVDALDSQDKGSAETVKSHDTPCAHDDRKPLTLGEKCCAISHMMVIDKFLQSGDDRSIIIEDDLIGSDEDIEEAVSITNSLKGNGLLVLGGQQGLKNAKHLSGNKLSENLWRIPSISSPFITRACCYALTRSSAEAILKSQNSCLTRSDFWCKYSKNIDIFYSDIFLHPIDLSGSSLETERNAGSFMQRVAEDGFKNLTGRFLLKALVGMAVLFGVYSRVEIK